MWEYEYWDEYGVDECVDEECIPNDCDVYGEDTQEYYICVCRSRCFTDECVENCIKKMGR